MNIRLLDRAFINRVHLGAGDVIDLEPAAVEFFLRSKRAELVSPVDASHEIASLLTGAKSKPMRDTLQWLQRHIANH